MPGIESLSFFQIPSPSSAPGVDSGVTVENSAQRAAKLAKDFEAMMLSQLLKQMRQSMNEDGLFAGDSADVHGGMFDMFLGKHLAEAGGIGLTGMLLRQMESTQPGPPADANDSRPDGARRDLPGAPRG